MSIGFPEIVAKRRAEEIAAKWAENDAIMARHARLKGPGCTWPSCGHIERRQCHAPDQIAPVVSDQGADLNGGQAMTPLCTPLRADLRQASALRIRNALHQLIHSPLSECDWDEAIEALVEHDRLTAWDNRNE